MYYLELLWRFVRFRVVFGTDFKAMWHRVINKKTRQVTRSTSALIETQISRGKQAPCENKDNHSKAVR